MIPLGFCQCGCGGRTRVARADNAKYGHVKGEPMRFLHGHSMRLKWKPLEVRFWEAVDRTDGCWLWTGRKYFNGYGRIGVNGGEVRAHRLSWELHNGPIPDGLLVCHHCDNPPCVNPEHLFLGTPADNMADMARKGRWYLRPRRTPRGDQHPSRLHPETRPRGEGHPMHKLTEADVLAIRASLRGTAAVAARFGISETHVHRVRRRDVWRHI